MKYKKGLIFICLIICLFSIASVCASEVNETMIASEGQSDELINIENQGANDIVGVEETTDEVVSVEKDGQVTKSVVDDVDSLSANSDGTFTDLANDIANATGELKLSKNYVYDPNKDSNYQNGIVINKEITINGRGFTIDGISQARAFYVQSNNVVIKNIKFSQCNDVNSNTGFGGAIHWRGDEGILSGCNFVSCVSSRSSSNKGGAVYWYGAEGSLFDCSFITCYSSSYGSVSSNSAGGAVYWDGNNGNLGECIFRNCYSNSYGYISGSGNAYSITSGGAIYWNGLEGNISNCNFTNCYSNSRGSSSGYGSHYDGYARGGAIFLIGNNSHISNSNFIGCYCYSAGNSGFSPVSSGGAISAGANEAYIFNCEFVSCSCNISTNLGSSSGHAISWSGSNGIMFNCSFNGDYYDYEKYCGGKAKPLLLIQTSSLFNDDNIVKFECTQLVNKINMSIYNVTDRIVLYKQFLLTSDELNSLATLNNLGEGEYQIVLQYPGDKFYSSVSTNDLFKIGKNSSFEVMIADNIVEGDTVTINLTLNEDATGKVKIVSSNFTFINDLIDGKTSFNIPNVSRGINTYKIKYEGDEKYNPIYITDTFNVFINSNIQLDLEKEYIFDENILLNYTITSNCTGIISIIVDDVFNANITVGEQFELENIPAGEHNITVIYNGDEHYFTSKNSTVIKVSKADPSIKVNYSNIPSTVSFEVILNEKATGNINVTINNNSYCQNITDGKVNIIIPNLNAGIYSARVYYKGDNNYNARIYDAVVIINKISTTVVGTANDITYLENEIINVRGSVDGIVFVNIDEIYINNISVMANTVTPINFGNIPSGRHDVTITLKPTNTNYNESTYNTEFTVSKKQTNVVATINDITYSETTIINVKGNVDGVVTVKIDNCYINSTNVKANTVTPITFDNMPAGPHDVSIILIPTNKNYNESSFNTEFSVSKKQTSIVLGVENSVYGEEIIINVTASEDGKITLKVGDITRERNVLANTMVKINMGVLASDSYNVVATFDAGGNYKISNKQTTLVVSPAKAEITTIQVQNNTYGENTIINVKTNVAGVLTVKLNNANTQTFNIHANKLTALDLGKYDVDNYDIDLTLRAGSNYTEATGNAKITVNPKQTTVELNVKNSVYGENVIVNVTASENGKVTVNVGTNVKTVDVELNKVTSVDFGILDVKYYEVNVTFDGGKNYQTSFNKDSLVVSQKASSVSMVDFVNSYVYGQNVIIKMKSDADGTLIVKVGDTPQTKQVTAGSVVAFDFGIFDVDNYDVTISLDAGSNYVQYQNTTSLTIAPKSTSIVLNTNGYDTTEIVIVNVTSSETGKVTVKLGSITKTIDVNANEVTFVDFGLLDAGLYDVVANFTAGNNYINSTDTGNVKVVSKIKEDDVNITIPDLIANQENQIVINLPSDATGTVTLIIGNNTYPFTVNNGVATVKVPKLEDGTYEYIIKYSGDNYYSSFSTSGNIDVSKPTPDVEIPPLDKPSSDGSVTINLPQGATGTVTLVIDKKPYSFPVQNGVAKIYMPELANGNYPYTITYSGDGRYSSFTKTGTVTVNKQTPPTTSVSKITIIMKTAKIKKSAKKLVLQATLKQGNTPLKNKMITFKFNGKKYTAKTNSKGVAKVTIKKAVLKKLKVGKKVKYQASYGKIIVKKTVKVKK